MDLATLALLGTVAAFPPAVEARFLGNAAFELTDGTSTLLLDFPYVSGASGYMAFSPDEIHPRSSALCRFTHRHADHFDADAVSAIGCTVAGPGEVQGSVPEALRAGPGPWRHGTARIECLPTAHAAVEHCSYRVSWHGVEIFVSGDVEELGALLQARQRFGVLLLASWLLPAAERLEGEAARTPIVVHHHAPGELVPPCDRCLVPEQGAAAFPLPPEPGGAVD